MFHYFYRIFIALSVLLNVLTGGQSNQTFSARNYQWKRDGRKNIVWLIDSLAICVSYIGRKVVPKEIHCVDRTHCMQSWVYWRSRKDVSWMLDTRPAKIHMMTIRHPYPEQDCEFET